MFDFGFNLGGVGEPKTLESRSLEAVAAYIKSGKVKRITVLTGAGISTSAGIPDFRSPGTGLYANLARLNLPYAEAVFDISYFRKHPEPFYYLAKELYPGKFHPTISHVFISLLAKKGLLQMLFTQNIDCLERRAGVPSDKIIEAHGSFASQRCIECKAPYPDDKILQHVENEVVPHCDACRGLVKPDIVFFGEALPEAFRNNIHLPAQSDLLIVIGTSLTVYPFAGLPEAAPVGVPRLLLNKERVGQMGRRTDDVTVLGSCDAGVRKLATMLGWHDELDDLWRSIVGEKEADRQLSSTEEKKEDDIEEEIRKMNEDVARALKLEESHGDKADVSPLDGEGFVAMMARILGGVGSSTSSSKDARLSPSRTSPPRTSPRTSPPKGAGGGFQPPQAKTVVDGPGAEDKKERDAGGPEKSGEAAGAAPPSDPQLKPEDDSSANSSPPKPENSSEGPKPVENDKSAAVSAVTVEFVSASNEDTDQSPPKPGVASANATVSS